MEVAAIGGDTTKKIVTTRGEVSMLLEFIELCRSIAIR
jgi:hypothetical protein